MSEARGPLRGAVPSDSSASERANFSPLAWLGRLAEAVLISLEVDFPVHPRSCHRYITRERVFTVRGPVFAAVRATNLASSRRFRVCSRFGEKTGWPFLDRYYVTQREDGEAGGTSESRARWMIHARARARPRRAREAAKIHVALIICHGIRNRSAA